MEIQSIEFLVNGKKKLLKTASFSKSSEVMIGTFTFSINDEGTYKILLTDLLPGTWQVLKDNKVVIPSIPVRSDDGILYFEGTKGKYALTK